MRFKMEFAVLLASGKWVRFVLNKEGGYSTKEDIRILIDILTASILENETCPGPFSGTEASWHTAACVHTVRLSLRNKVAGERPTNRLGSWPVLIPTSCLGFGRELSGTDLQL